MNCWNTSPNCKYKCKSTSLRSSSWSSEAVSVKSNSSGCQKRTHKSSSGRFFSYRRPWRKRRTKTCRTRSRKNSSNSIRRNYSRKWTPTLRCCKEWRAIWRTWMRRTTSCDRWLNSTIRRKKHWGTKWTTSRNKPNSITQSSTLCYSNATPSSTKSGASRTCKSTNWPKPSRSTSSESRLKSTSTCIPGGTWSNCRKNIMNSKEISNKPKCPWMSQVKTMSKARRTQCSKSTNSRKPTLCWRITWWNSPKLSSKRRWNYTNQH